MKQLTLFTVMLLAFFSAFSQTKNFIDQPYIDVNGSADTLVTPNEIYIRISISEKDTKDRQSVEELEQKMVTALKDLGIDIEKDLTMSDMASNFKLYFLKDKDIIKTKIYTLKVTDAVVAANVFMKLEENGISNTSIERVDHSELDKFKNQMLTKAIVDAKEKAVVLTKPLNQSLGMAIYIQSSDSNISQLLEGNLAGLKIRGANKSYYNQPPKIDFEKIKVAASVKVVFVLK